jgi:uncharacterized phage-associated protein
MLFSNLKRIFFIIFLIFCKTNSYAVDDKIVKSVKEDMKKLHISETPSTLWDVAQFFISLEKERLEGCNLHLVLEDFLPETLRPDNAPAIIKLNDGGYNIIVNRGGNVERILPPKEMQIDSLASLFQNILLSQDVTQGTVFMNWDDPIMKELTLKGGHTRLERKIEAPPLDRWKLQKLCYYAQGYYLAKFNQPLFKEDLKAYYYGPYNSDLNNQCKESGIYNARTLNKDKLKEFILSINLTPHKAHFLSFIFNINLNKSGKMLVNESHKEDPWLSTPFGQAIEQDKLKNFFVSDIQCQEYMSNFVELELGSASSPSPQQHPRLQIDQNSPQSMVKYINEMTDDNSKDALLILGAIKKLISAKDTIDNIYDSTYKELIKLNHNVKYFFDSAKVLKDGSLYDIWPNQKQLDILLSSLFFPKELEELYEPAIALYGRNYLLLGLAYSAKHGNLLALYHLASAFKLYESDLDGDNENEDEEEDKEKNPLREMREELEKTLEDHLKEILGSDHLQSQCSYFSLGQLCNFMNREEEACKYYKNGMEIGDLRAEWALVDFTENSKAAYQSLSVKMPTVLIDLARLNDNPQDIYDQYLDAGRRGISEGFHRAALMIINGQVNGEMKDAIALFRDAGRLGRTVSYAEAAASLFEYSPGSIKDIKALYRSQGIDGDPNGYLSLHKLYNDLEKESKFEESKAEESFRQIKGPLSFRCKSNYEDYFKCLYSIFIER